MAKRKLDRKRFRICLSSSVLNFRDKLLKRTGLKEHGAISFSPVLFVGLYHWVDYMRFILHRGEKRVFWCGSDIRNLFTSKFFRRIGNEKAEHYCENEVEQKALMALGIYAYVTPMIFAEPNETITYQWAKRPHVFMSAHVGREREYGIGIIENIYKRVPEVTFHIYGIDGASHDNIIYHGHVPEDTFKKEIQDYQAAIRLNVFDGFSEVLAQSILHGQYPISFISYPHITNAKSLNHFVKELKDLKNKKEPNLDGREYWINKLENSLEAITT